MIINTYTGKKELIYIDDLSKADLITHSGTFHADDIFSTVLLLNVLDKEKITINRTNQTDIQSNGIVYDIGLGEFDHHQNGGNGLHQNGIKKASFGLLWDKYGKDFLKGKTEEVELAFVSIKETLIYHLDAVDNGQLESSNNFNINIIDIPVLFSMFNKNWNEDKNSNDLFIESINVASLLFNKIVNTIICKISAKKIVDNAINKSMNGLMILDQHVPWEEFVTKSPNPKAKDILFVIYPDNRSAFALKAVPISYGSFTVKKKLPLKWAGLRDRDLVKITGVETACFCHNALFMCCANSKEGIMQLAKLALENND